MAKSDNFQLIISCDTVEELVKLTAKLQANIGSDVLDQTPPVTKKTTKKKPAKKVEECEKVPPAVKVEKVAPATEEPATEEKDVEAKTCSQTPDEKRESLRVLVNDAIKADKKNEIDKVALAETFKQFGFTNISGITDDKVDEVTELVEAFLNA